jgi:riboflavin synthase
MFTGIVRERGRLVSLEQGDGGARLRIFAPQTAQSTEKGGSVAVNGVCLTAVAIENGTLSFDAVPETLRRSSLGRLEPGADVNIEPPLRAGDPLGGHIVQGHVDGVGSIVAAAPDLRVRMPRELLRYVVGKGSVTVDGVSLTVVDVLDDGFTVAVIPHTAAVTTLGRKGPGDQVNLEVDVTVKYVERLLTWNDGGPPAGPTAKDA